MNYPVWYLPEVGGGFLIALIAVLHVFVSHFAVGGGLYLIYSEKKGLREENQGILDFTRYHARFFLLITMVFGSISGVGIWFIIALVNPAATSILIHTFVFGWAAEWVFFLVEITAAFVYFYTFGRMDSATHLKVGWVYFVSAWMSLLLINGIIGFMLTPGGWLQNHNFWIGFFNPSFLPSLFFRTFIAIMLAGVYGYLSASFTKDRTIRETMTRFSSKWALWALAGALPSGLWYVAVLPDPAQALVLGKSPTIMAALGWGLVSILILLAVTLIAGIFRPSFNLKPVAAAAMICALLTMGSFEWIREAARRPYAINEIIYSNMIMKDDVADISGKGFMKTARWVQTREITDETRALAGEELFMYQCYACHTLGGFNNDLKPLTAQMSFGALDSYIKRIHQLRYFMPPFAGNEAESQALAAYIAGSLHGKEVVLASSRGSSSVEGSAEGTILFENNCSACHEMADLSAAFAEKQPAEIAGMLATLDQISDQMVPFAGSAAEAEKLSLFLSALGNPDAQAAGPGGGGEAQFENNCSACHSLDEMTGILAGFEKSDFRQALDKLDTLSKEMPPLETAPEEKDALTEYLYQPRR